MTEENEISMSPKRYSRGYFFYTAENSPALKINPLVKLFIMLSVSISVFFTEDFLLLFLELGITVLLILFSRIPLSMIKKFILALSGMATGVFIINILFSHYAGDIVYFDYWVFRIPQLNWGWNIYITNATLKWASLLFLRTMVLVWISLWFLIVTKDRDIIYSMRKIGIPRGAAFLFALALRSVSMFYGDYVTVMEAMKSKGVSFDEGSIISRLRKFGRVLFPLVLLAVKRIEDFSRSIEARGFSIKCKRKLYVSYPISKLDLFLMGIFTCMLVFIILSEIMPNFLTTIIQILGGCFSW